ncbi:uncharacterized protein LOC105700505 [Orussus abietinus]|uniref:uncharacterized protein LOC105700505 n=1 Tax=Orussus abietinus TaxID=222816 RepID=UPI0006263025|nr:uncharacterized protein LOC105700505 [Orussus abietinus]
MTLSEIEAKFASMFAVGVGSFVVGMIPICFAARGREVRRKLLLSSLLCFGGGVLLATALLHMLPEIRETLPDYAELMFCCGFLFLYLVDETVHYFWGTDVESPRNGNNNETPCQERTQDERRCQQSRQGSSISQVDYSVMCKNNVPPAAQQPYLNFSFEPNIRSNIAPQHVKNTHYGSIVVPSHVPSCCTSGETLLCHGNHTEPCAKSNTGIMGLLVALTLHAVLEGLAIGLQNESVEVLLLVGAVASHKLVVGFCLGLELIGSATSLLKYVVAMSLFSGGSSLGIGIGMWTSRVHEQWTTVVIPVMSGLAGGTLLYVTVSEVLPRERAKWHKSSRRSAGIVQFLAVLCGFFLIFLLNKYMESAHSIKGKA